jgi:hypothetical protein
VIQRLLGFGDSKHTCKNIAATSVPIQNFQRDIVHRYVVVVVIVIVAVVVFVPNSRFY